jgi:hypothetical protein
VGGANTFDTEGKVAGAAVVVVLSDSVDASAVASVVVIDSESELLQLARELPAMQRMAKPNPTERNVLNRG